LTVFSFASSCRSSSARYFESRLRLLVRAVINELQPVVHNTRKMRNAYRDGNGTSGPNLNGRDNWEELSIDWQHVKVLPVYLLGFESVDWIHVTQID